MSNIDNTTKLIWKYAMPDTDEKPILSILICSLFERELFLSTLYEEFKKQITNEMANVEVVVLITDKTISIGEKRNWLLNKANGEYLCFFDDDDMPTPNYIKLLIKALESKRDCCSLKGIITFDGQNPEVFEHSIKYKEWKTTTNDNASRYFKEMNFGKYAQKMMKDIPTTRPPPKCIILSNHQ
jgi:cellulose synthase/poly-beta-1,6-N-acetylglucosamine synthase-like glycosyltransferase